MKQQFWGEMVEIRVLQSMKAQWHNNAPSFNDPSHVVNAITRLPDFLLNKVIQLIEK